MSSKFSIVTSAADGCGKPSSIRLMDSSHSSNMEQKESFMFSNRSSVSRGCSLAAVALAASAAIGLAVGTASAAVITVLNSNFASPTTTSWTTQSTSVSPGEDTNITSWGVSTGNPAAGVQYYSSSVGQVCYVNGTGTIVYQDVGALQANTDYTLTADIIANSNGQESGNSAEIALVNTASDSDTSTQVAAGTTESSNSILNTLTLTPLTTSFATGNSVSGDLSIELSSGSTQVMFTNVGLTSSAVPEPASLGLVAIGSLGLLLRRRKAV